jgi:hypothetical protein
MAEEILELTKAAGRLRVLALLLLAACGVAQAAEAARQASDWTP